MEQSQQRIKEQEDIIKKQQETISCMADTIAAYEKQKKTVTALCTQNAENLFRNVNPFESIITKDLNEKDLEIIGNGLLSLLDQAEQAKKLIRDKSVLDKIDVYCKEVLTVHEKIVSPGK